MKTTGMNGADGSEPATRSPMTPDQQRLQTLEAKALAFDLILCAVIDCSERRSMILDAIDRDMSEWDRRATVAAQSELAEAARAQVSRILQDFRSISKSERTN